MSTGPTLAPIEAAFTRFKSSVSSTDARTFDNTTLQDVWTAAKDVEQQLAARRSYCNLRRIEPFLKGLDHYSKAVEVLCNGTPYLPWIWAPIKLFLQISSDSITAFEKLIKAYSEIAEALPRFDRLSSALQHQSDFQGVLAVFYCDILEFHRRSYKFFRASAWKRFFDSSWGRFDLRFNAILQSLKQHAELVDKEANAHSIALAQTWRETYLDRTRKQEQDRHDDHFLNVLRWLDYNDRQQQDYIDAVGSNCHDGSVDWFIGLPKVRAWLGETPQHAVLWAYGIPGSGKSVAAVQLIRQLEANPQCTILAYVCNFRIREDNNCSHVLRSLIYQVIKKHPKFVPYVYDEYIVKGVAPSKSQLKQLLAILLSALSSSRIAIDGLDECSDGEQKELLGTLLPLMVQAASSTTCKIIVVSRDTALIRKSLGKHPQVSFKEEAKTIEKAIQSFVHAQITILKNEHGDSILPASTFDTVEQKLVSKADGMFLWVRLMLTTLDNVHSAWELEAAVDNLPSGLDEAYGRVLQRISEDIPHGNLRKARSIFAWVACADRPLKTYELLDGITLSNAPYTLSDQTKLSLSELDRCKPLIEIDNSGNVGFVHFTVKEYILDRCSGPFLSSESALRQIALGCTGYMNTCFGFIDPETDTTARVTSVVSRLHVLHNYASSSWLGHLQRLAQATRGLQDEANVHVARLATAVCARHAALTEILGRPPLVQSSVRRDTSLSSLSGIEPLYLLAQRVREDERAATVHGLDSSEVEPISRLLLDDITTQYQAIAQQLLYPDVQRLYPWLDTALLVKFRQTSANTAFTCHFATCPRRSNGFPLASERDEHERSHSARLSCPEPTCQYSIGFSNASQLERHNKKFHVEDDRELPVFRNSARVSLQLQQQDRAQQDGPTGVHSAPNLPIEMQMYMLEQQRNQIKMQTRQQQMRARQQQMRNNWDEQQQKKLTLREYQKLKTKRQEQQERLPPQAVQHQQVQHNGVQQRNHEQLETPDLHYELGLPPVRSQNRSSDSDILYGEQSTAQLLQQMLQNTEEPTPGLPPNTQMNELQQAIDACAFPAVIPKDHGISVPREVQTWDELKRYITQNQAALPPHALELVQDTQFRWFRLHPEELEQALHARTATVTGHQLQPPPFSFGEPHNDLAALAQTTDRLQRDQGVELNTILGQQGQTPIFNMPSSQDLLIIRERNPQFANASDDQIRQFLRQRRKDNAAKAGNNIQPLSQQQALRAAQMVKVQEAAAGGGGQPAGNLPDIYSQVNRLPRDFGLPDRATLLEEAYRERRNTKRSLSPTKSNIKVAEFTPLISPASQTYADVVKEGQPEFEVPGSYFSPLTSPALHALSDTHRQAQDSFDVPNPYFEAFPAGD